MLIFIFYKYFKRFRRSPVIEMAVNVKVAPGKKFSCILPVVHLGAILKQQLHQIEVAVLGGEMQSRVAALVSCIDVGTTYQQQLSGLGVSLPHGIVQGPEALGHRLIRFSTACEEDADLIERL